MKKLLGLLFCCLFMGTIGCASVPMIQETPQIPVYKAFIVNASPYPIDVKVANLEKGVMIKEFNGLLPGAKILIKIPENLLGNFIGVAARFYIGGEPTKWFSNITPLTKSEYEQYPGVIPFLKIKEPKKKGIDV